MDENKHYGHEKLHFFTNTVIAVEQFNIKLNFHIKTKAVSMTSSLGRLRLKTSKTIYNL